MNNDFEHELEIKKTKMISKIICIIILIIVIIIILGFLSVKYIFKEIDKKTVFRPFHLIEKYESPNKKFILEINGTGASWPFGDEDIKIIAYKSNVQGKLNKKIFNTKISNDGKTLDRSNYNVNWDNNTVLITLSGEEQKNEYILVSFDDDIKFKHKGLYYEVKSTNNSKIVKSFSSYDYYSNRDIEINNINVNFLVNGEYRGIDSSYVDIKDLIITMDYEVEDKIATKKWEKLGNADIYKNYKMTFIICYYDRYNNDYKDLQNEDYIKFILGDENLNYSYDLCKP